jgi:hypothetical protein
MIAFACLLDGPSKNHVESMIQLALENVVNLLQDKNDRVKIASATTLNRISELYPMSILNHPNFGKICPLLANSINSKPKVIIYYLN